MLTRGRSLWFSFVVAVTAPTCDLAVPRGQRSRHEPWDLGSLGARGKLGRSLRVEALHPSAEWKVGQRMVPIRGLVADRFAGAFIWKYKATCTSHRHSTAIPRNQDPGMVLEA